MTGEKEKVPKRRVILQIAQSLDGFIAERNGSTEWLTKLDSTEADNAYQRFYASIDTVIMGRKTYQRALKLAGSYPYQDKQSYVFSTTLHDTDDPTTVVAGNVAGFVQSLKEKKGKDIWLVGGADIFTDLLQAGLIDEIMVTVAPVLLGDGVSLVSHDLPDIPLTLKEGRQLGQFIQLTYTVGNVKN
ncbi:dihydrofolate reductase family protein [Schleiferilactobacillus perolens]|nr:dihydrofolate reductase family protein [Schleiferilactobacillus perolens]MCI1913077.1 dihydrofolate reductase family protein [Schleiferilactobacillus harbinensis]MCI2172470.1 dihydrofolate reductase family protein [Schleiferilactobacillus perolens]